MVTCKKCNGSGLVKRIKPFVCKFEHAEDVNICIFCENKNKSLYIDCDICKGTGDVKEELQ